MPEDLLNEDLVVTARTGYRDEIPLYIPQFADLMIGLDYDLAEREHASHSNDFTTHPIEDPQQSFLIDHNREAPTELSLTMIVSASSCGDGVQGVERINSLIDSLLTLRARQATSVDSFTTIYTGLRVYENMAIRTLDFLRDENTPNTMTIDIELIEFRFAMSPRMTSESFRMQANNGQRDTRNQPLVMTADRPTVEATRVRREPRLRVPLPSEETLIRMALRRLGAPRLALLDIAYSSGAI